MTKAEQIQEMRDLANQRRGYVDDMGRTYEHHADRWDRLADLHQMYADAYPSTTHPHAESE